MIEKINYFKPKDLKRITIQPIHFHSMLHPKPILQVLIYTSLVYLIIIMISMFFNIVS